MDVSATGIIIIIIIIIMNDNLYSAVNTSYFKGA